MLDEDLSRTERIARLNDRARSGFDSSARIVFTRGCLDAFCSGDTSARLLTQAQLIAAIRRYRFDEDAWGERDFGRLTFEGQTIFFKIDYYDTNLKLGSDEPADAFVTARLVTIMLASEY